MKLADLAQLLADHPPTVSLDDQRLAVFRELDRILLDGRLTSAGGAFDIGGPGRSPEANPIKELYEYQMRKALSEIETARVDQGIAVWQLYNMGYIFKTPEVTFGIDVVSGPISHDWRWPIPEDIVTRLTDCIDLLLVTHNIDNYRTHPWVTWYHTDHCDRTIVDGMLRSGKPVFIPTGHEPFSANNPQLTFAGHHQSHDVLGLHVTSYGGRHAYQDNPFDTPHVLYEVITPSDDKVFFTGDFDYTSGETYPYKHDIDILILHSGGVSPLYDDQNPNDLGDDDDAFFLGMQRFRSRFVVAGHLGELTHPPGGGRESYLMACDIFRQLLGNADTRVVVMFWGEKIVIPTGRL